VSILSDRINATVDIFSDKTSDILFLYGLPQPPFLTNSVYANAANATNKGVEAMVGSRIISNANFEWSALANFTVVRNKITNLSRKFRGADPTVSHDYGSAIGRGLSGAFVTQLQVGYPAGVFFVPQHVGFDEQGHELYNSYDDNGKLIGTSTSYSNKDKIFIDPTARFTWAFTNSFSYKDLDLDFMLRGVQGQKVFANSLLNLGSKVYLPSLNVSTDALTNGFTEQPQPTDYWIENGSFARLEHVTIGYTFRKLSRIQSLKIYAVATNLFVITSYKGSDPEIRVEGSQRYIDVDFYPKMRTIGVGAKLDL
jgi:iron complex outermembrane receptor protein